MEVIQDWSKQTFFNGIGIYAVNKVVPDFTTQQPDMIKRNLSRGASWYLASELSEQMLTGDSNFKNFTTEGDFMKGFRNAVSDTVFFGLVSGVIERTELNNTFYSLFNQSLRDPNIADFASLGFMLTASQKLGDHLEAQGWRWVRNFGEQIGL